METRPNVDLSTLVAMTTHRVIGFQNRLPWGRNMPSDLARFKKITRDIGTVVVGRTTFDSLLEQIGEPLPGRHHIVMTRRQQCITSSSTETSVETAEDVTTALKLISLRGGRAAIIGGAQIYKAFLPYVSKVHCTVIHADMQGDTTFPHIPKDFCCSEDSGPARLWSARDAYTSTFYTYQRVLCDEGLRTTVKSNLTGRIIGKL